MSLDTSRSGSFMMWMTALPRPGFGPPVEHSLTPAAAGLAQIPLPKRAADHSLATVRP